ncbi:hypothetical protein [Actinomadura napierensis]|uniref:Transcriptional regulator n=1 Tax=Actinomadura napierensis TaxID=267854 RepID=A0ABN2Y3N3_9ACTN
MGQGALLPVDEPLTDSGRGLRLSLQGLSTWFERHGSGIVAAQEAYDRRQDGDAQADELIS